MCNFYAKLNLCQNTFEKPRILFLQVCHSYRWIVTLYFFYFVFLSVEQVICKILQFILLTHLGKVMKYTLDRYKDRHQSIPGHRHHLFLQSLQGAILGSLIDLNMHVLDRGRTRVHGKDPCRPERTCKFHRERPFGNSTKGNGLNPQLKPDNICYELAF